MRQSGSMVDYWVQKARALWIVLTKTHIIVVGQGKFGEGEVATILPPTVKESDCDCLYHQIAKLVIEAAPE